MKMAVSILLMISTLGCATKDSSSELLVAGVSCVAGCGVTFSEIVPKRGHYDGKEIYISGFVAIANGRLSLQPSEEAYMSSVGDLEAIFFNVPQSVQKEIINAHLNSYVSVRGVFNVGSRDGVAGVGYFSGDVDVYKKIIRERAESVEDWGVRLEDLD